MFGSNALAERAFGETSVSAPISAPRPGPFAFGFGAFGEYPFGQATSAATEAPITPAPPLNGKGVITRRGGRPRCVVIQKAGS